jgi:hypothetical protein
MDRQEGNMGEAPRVTLEAIEAIIVDERYFTAYQGAWAAIEQPVYNKEQMIAATEQVQALPKSLRLLTICVLTLKNGYTVHGTSACASPDNFNQEIGERIARQNAVNQIWPLMGYELRSKLHRLQGASDADLGEALTRMTAYALGNKEAFRPEHADIILEHFTNGGEDNGEEGGVTRADTKID